MYHCTAFELAEHYWYAGFVDVPDNVQAVTSESAIQTLALCYAPDMVDRDGGDRSSFRFVGVRLGLTR